MYLADPAYAAGQVTFNVLFLVAVISLVVWLVNRAATRRRRRHRADPRGAPGHWPPPNAQQHPPYHAHQQWPPYQGGSQAPPYNPPRHPPQP
jgi:hypothetical protein